MTNMTHLRQKIKDIWTNPRRNIFALSILLIISISLNLIYATHLHMINRSGGGRGYTSEYGHDYRNMGAYRQLYSNKSTQIIRPNFNGEPNQTFVTSFDTNGVRVYQSGSTANIPVTQMSAEEAHSIIEQIKQQEIRMNQMWEAHEQMMNQFTSQFGI